MRSASLRARAVSVIVFFSLCLRVLRCLRSAVTAAMEPPRGTGPRASVLASVDLLPRGQQVHLGPGGHPPLAPVQDVLDVPEIAGHHRDAYLGPAVKVLLTGLGHTHRELAV